MELIYAIVERVDRIERELKGAPLESGQEIANRTFDKEMEESAVREKRDKAQIMDETAKKIELLEREIRDILREKRDKNVLDKIESRIEHIEMEMSRHASQEKRDKFSLMTVVDKIANRLDRMEGQLRDAPSEKGEKSVVDEMATRVERIERKIEEDIPQEKKFKALLMSVLDGITTRVERIESEMKNGQVDTKDKLQLMGREMADNRQDRIQRDSEEAPVIARPKSVLGEIARRVERIERDIRTVLLKKGDKVLLMGKENKNQQDCAFYHFRVR
ncbi:unnamed protein product [Cylicostephanus goldi]|uniref:Uncharacterized protein n=1 Tax=Cylicostephanus goldi TaxID=71465 RepID=A0A3P6RQV1_CYLGO|nr:unnamed protein product [Cylicostephanus goldi]